jgi:hypothetical protein
MTVPAPSEPIPADPQPGPLEPDVPGNPPSPVDLTEHYENEPPHPEAEESTEPVEQPKTEAQIDKELADSFPTSDPPSSWAGPTD